MAEWICVGTTGDTVKDELLRTAIRNMANLAGAPTQDCDTVCC